MKKIFFISFSLCWVSGFAQNLTCTDITKFDDPLMCTNGESNACIAIEADKSLPLGFYSNLDSLNDIHSDISSGMVIYHLTFKTGSDFSDRVLTIKSTRALFPVRLQLGDLIAKESRTYSVALILCYKPAMDSALTKFKAGEYAAAKTLFKQAQECKYDKPNDGVVERNLLDVDSIMRWQREAEEYAQLLDFSSAITCYRKIRTLNPKDEINNKKLDDVNAQNVQFCEKYFKQAQKFYNYHEYEKALILFKNVSDIGCYYQDSANYMISMVKRAIAADKDKRGVFTYEIGFNASTLLPIGFQIGSYNTKKAGFYWSFFSNPQIFYAMRPNYPKSIAGSVGSTIGITFRPIPKKYDKVPIWFHLGVGYALMSNFKYQNAAGNTVNYNGETLTDQKLTFSPYHAIPFEAGITVKIWYFVLRYTFQYRFWFVADKNTCPMCEPYIHKIGFGFCW